MDVISLTMSGMNREWSSRDVADSLSACNIDYNRGRFSVSLTFPDRTMFYPYVVQLSAVETDRTFIPVNTHRVLHRIACGYKIRNNKMSLSSAALRTHN